VVGAVVETDLDALHGVARDGSLRERLDAALLHRRDEALRDDAALDGVLELEAGALGKRLDLDVAVAELPAPARLLLVAMTRACLLADRLLVRNARRVELDLDVKARVEPVDRDLDLHLRQAREELLAGLRVST
jgi:hypothetical protein